MIKSKTVSWNPPAAGALWVMALLALVAAAPDSCFGLGFRIPNQDPVAISRGNAFVATADNPSAIYYNPAGITQLSGQDAQVNTLFYLDIDADYESFSGTRVENNPEIIPVPSFYYTCTPDQSRFSFGLGVYAPFGLSIKWPETAPFSSYGMAAKVTYITANPVVAYKLCDTLSLAIGPTINYSKAKLRTAPGGPGTEFLFTGDNVGYGFTAGLLWQPDPKWSFGASYRSESSIDYKGTAFFSPSPPLPPRFPSSASLNTPQVAIVGVSYRPTPNWNFEVNVDWADWETFKQVTITGVTTIPFDWHSSFFYEAGATRYFKGGWFASAGYFFSQNSTSDRFYNPVVPDGDIHVATFGFGRTYEHWRWAVSGEVIAGTWNNVNNHAVDPSVNGRYRLFSPTVAVSVGYRF
ncbi:MAG TPA: outer membrane protein transport protein [Verrucomicrobiae bacterium]|jgi:long-chain fatty acid transport protein